MFFTINLSQDQSRHSPYLSNTLISKMEKTLHKGEKVLLYLNKRGAFSSMVCKDCQHLFECPNCDVSLSVHHNPDHFLCHICHHNFSLPTACNRCGGVNLQSVGIGTQQVESLMRGLFPGRRVFRFDSDSMKNKSSKSAALEQVESSDIIIGTKMLTTGFNFKKLGLICVILTEGELSFGSYAAEEKAYQNLRQLIGRGNRLGQKTHILLQSFIPDNAIIKRLTQYNFKEFMIETLKERKEFHYPPYYDFVELEYRSSDASKTLAYIAKLKETLEGHNADKSYIILAATSTFRKHQLHHASLIIKGHKVRELLTPIKKKILSDKYLSVIFHDEVGLS